MNKSLICSVAFLTITSPLLADRGLSVEVRSSAFIHTSQRFRDVYDTVGPSYAIEVSKRLYPQFDAWIDTDFFYKDKTQHSCCKSQIDILNTSFGLKYLHPLAEQVSVYVGLGPTFAWTYIRNSGCCGSEYLSRFTPGLVVKSGLYYQFLEPYYLDVFVDYIYQPIHFQETVDIGGVKAGLGLGICF